MSGIKDIRQLTQNRFLNFYEMDAVKRDGSIFPYYMASRAESERELCMNLAEKGPDGVAIFGLYGEKHDRVVMIRQYRYPIGGYVYEFPAGLVEKGEDYHETAVREMREETGLDLTLLSAPEVLEKPYFTTVGMTDENCSMVYGYCSGCIDRSALESSEDIEVVLADRKEVMRILREEKVALICAYMLTHFLQDTQDPFAFLRIGYDGE